MPKPLHIIVACSENRVIGRGGRLPWSIPEDSVFFQNKTLGHTVIMGARSFGEWPGCINGRDVIVVTHTPSTLPPSVHTTPSLTEAIAKAQSLRGEIYLCGGQRIYEEGLPFVDILHLTLIHTEITDGDTFFPDWRDHFTREMARRDSHDDHWRYTFLTLER
ncbi:MAG TPA: dihydrofolate reductase [Rariglobus sp.]|jgi:dihydrofolate reductase|nr:dihydrofolate reductase [Rariglobus sp.]